MRQQGEYDSNDRQQRNQTTLAVHRSPPTIAAGTHAITGGRCLRFDVSRWWKIGRTRLLSSPCRGDQIVGDQLWSLSPVTGRLLERVRELQNTPIIARPSDNLQPHRQSLGRKTGR